MTELRGITWEHSRGYDCLLATEKAWAARNPAMSVEWTARSLQAFADAPLDALTAEYDLLVIDHPHVPEAHDLGLLLPLEGPALDELRAQSVGLSHVSYEHGGHQYGLATDAAAQVAVFRPDLLSEPPRTWPEVFELAAAGRVLWPAKPVDAISSLLTLAGTYGVPLAGNVFVERDAGLSILADLHRLADAVPRECLHANPIEVAEMLATGDDFDYAPLVFGYTNYSRAGYRQCRLAYVDAPAGPDGVRGSCLGGAGIAVSARTAHPEEAAAYAFWLASAEVQRGPYFLGGGQPGNAVAWDDDATNAATWDFFRNTRSTLESARLRPRYARWLDVQDAAGTAISRALLREIDDDACLREIERSYAASRES